MYDDYEHDFDEKVNWRDEEGYGFADPGGKSALRAASKNNPRNLPCPTCGCPDRLTPRDVEIGYQCDSCADATEQGIDIRYCDEEEG